jgi:hypothetical protein
MDYLFSNEQIDLIVKNFNQKSNKYIIIMTPSVLNLSLKNNKLLLLFNFFSYLYFLFCINISKISRGNKFKKYLNDHKRSAHDFINLFKKNKFYLIECQYHLINNSNYSLFLFKN